MKLLGSSIKTIGANILLVILITTVIVQTSIIYKARVSSNEQQQTISKSATKVMEYIKKENKAIRINLENINKKLEKMENESKTTR